MEEDKSRIAGMVHAYCEAVHTQNEADFRALWADRDDNTLISVGKVYTGTDEIYHDFLIGCIQKNYREIRLIAEAVDIHLADAAHAIAVFRYHTECIRRETGEPYGISGVETQVFLKEDGEWKLTHLHYSKV